VRSRIRTWMKPTRYREVVLTVSNSDLSLERHAEYRHARAAQHLFSS
jgi:hypothetical protein